MINRKWRKALQPKNVLLAAVLAVAGVSAVAQNLPDLGLTSGDPWNADLYYENHTALRDKAGLSKFRNTLQSEMSKNLNDGWRFRGILRGTYDGVYDLNKSQYGKNAGGSVDMANALGAATGHPTLPYGGGFGLGFPAVAPASTGLGALVNTGANAQFLPVSYGSSNPNQGLQILGSGWNNSGGYGVAGVMLATPVRPCNYDSRGCADFGGYGNKSQAELAAPEFNSRLDFIREAYVTKTIGMDGGQSTFLKLGKQQVVWGRTDLFRVLDVINPVDYSRNNIYDELQDIRIPMWIAQAEYRMGASENMQDRNLSVVWNFDQFRPNNLGQGGTPNSILDAGNLFRALKNCWDNGCTVGNFASGGVATNFGAGQIGIRNVDLPNWSLANTQLGVKFEGVSKEGLSFSLNALTYRSQLPSLHGGKAANNPFLGTTAGTVVPGITDASGNYPGLIAFDMVYPRVNLVGGSMDFQIESLGAAMRLEGAYTRGEEFANTMRSELYSSNPVWRSVIGFDRPTFVPFISTERTVLFSGQLFYQHIFNHETQVNHLSGRMMGMPDWKDNAIATLLMKAFLMNDRLSPEIIFARDFRAQANVIAPAVEWIYTDNLKFKFGANVKFGPSQDRNQWDDTRTNIGVGGDPYLGVANTGSSGGAEPLGRFRAGPIGTAFGQNEVYATLRYKF